MLFAYDLVVPANTTEADLTSAYAQLVTGDVTRIGIEFKAGCAWLVRATVDDVLHQLVPANPDETIHADGAIIWSTLRYPLTCIPARLIMKAWSNDDRYEHTLTFYFDIEPAGGQSWESMFLSLFAQPLSSSED